MVQSIRVPNSIEIIRVTPVNPLVSKCEIKVCYVGDEPNRNKSIITKEVAREMANSLPYSPIVGYFNEQKGDFGGHERELEIRDGKIKFKDITQPYGFVDSNARIWFEKFIENNIEREYLMTEGFIWTGQYPESKRIIEQGNNQSMELDDKIINAFWTKDNKGNPQFFIINEAIFSKLCILGDDVEPCFEGSRISGITFSLEDEFKIKMFALMEEMKTILEGGASNMDNLENTLVENETPVEDVVPPAEEESTPEVEEPVVEEPVAPEGEPAEEIPADPEPEVPEEITPEEPVATTYDLNDVVEYQDLLTRYSELETNYAALTAANESLNTELTALRAFKASIDKEKKENMINSFYMLSDEEKQDVRNNIDTYSLDEIEAKLSIICVRNKVSFALDDEDTETKPGAITYNLNDFEEEAEGVPAWIKSLKSVAENM